MRERNMIKKYEYENERSNEISKYGAKNVNN